MEPERVAAAVAAVGEVGPYFRVGLVGDAHGTPLAEVSDDALLRYTRDVCRRLASTELRVGASTWQFGLAARAWSVALGCLAISGVVPQLGGLVLVGDDDRPRLCLRPTGGWEAPGPDGAMVASSELAARELANLEAAARELVAQVLGGLNPLHDRLVEATGIARGLLDGNAAAAVVGSAASLKRFGQHRYGALRELEPLMSVVLQLDGVRDWLELAPPTSGRTGLTRRSCCLYYRTPKGGVCGDCPVRDTAQGHPKARVN